MTDSFLTQDHVSEFRERGFLRIPEVFTPEELGPFADAVDRAVADRSKHDSRSLEERSRYEQSFRQCLNLWEDFPDVRALTFHPRIGQAAQQLLETERVRIWHDQALYKEAGGRVTDPHQDLPYWAISEPDAITAWIPFQDVDLENGAVGYMPGSHRSGLRAFADIFLGEGLDLDAHTETRERDFEFVRPRLGDVVFHHGLTIHRAYPNQTKNNRRAHTVIFFRDGCTRNKNKHPCVDRADILVGEAIKSDVTPVAWPREEGDLPRPPPPPDPAIPGWKGWRATQEQIKALTPSIVIAKS